MSSFGIKERHRSFCTQFLSHLRFSLMSIMNVYVKIKTRNKKKILLDIRTTVIRNLSSCSVIYTVEISGGLHFLSSDEMHKLKENPTIAKLTTANKRYVFFFSSPTVCGDWRVLFSSSSSRTPRRCRLN